ncbi:MAG: hypothetical protein ABL958_21345, partial [Bdellovibrionia bacterium]
MISKLLIIFSLALTSQAQEQTPVQGLQACLDLQTKNSGTRDPLRDLLTSDFRCSVPSWVPKVFFLPDDPALVFHSACIVHDLCYKHGSYSYNISRKSCDEDFKSRMLKTCNARYLDENLFRCRIDAGNI